MKGSYTLKDMKSDIKSLELCTRFMKSIYGTTEDEKINSIIKSAEDTLSEVKQAKEKAVRSEDNNDED